MYMMYKIAPVVILGHTELNPSLFTRVGAMDKVDTHSALISVLL